MLNKVVAAAQRHSGVFSWGVGGVLVTAWTLIRFFTQQSTYDLITQQLIARSWLHGNFGSVTIGVTNYIFKLLFLYIPLDILPGSPRLKLILLTLLVNFVTFVLIFKLSARIMQELGIAKNILGMAILWLAAIAGSVFWIQYTNSRNLEVVGGLLLIYWGLKYLRTGSNRLALALTAFSSGLFFSDNLQLYMTALPLVVYAALVNKYDWRRIGNLTIFFAAAFLGSKAIFWLFAHLFNINFLSSSGLINIRSVGNMIHAVPRAVKTTLDIFSGAPPSVGYIKYFNLLFLLLSAVLFIMAVAKRWLPRRVLAFVLVYFLVDELVYIVSGQAALSGTGRYLIMLPMVGILAIASLSKLPTKLGWFPILLGAVLILNFAGLTISLAKNWNPGFSLDAHQQSVAEYARQKSQPIVFASMDTALTTQYYQYARNTEFVALSCNGQKLRLATATPKAKIYSYPKMSPLILDQSQITNYPMLCGINLIEEQLGVPLMQDRTSDGSVVLWYSSTVLKDIN